MNGVTGASREHEDYRIRALGIGDGATTWHGILQVGGYLIKKMTKVRLRGYPAYLLPSEHRLVKRHIHRQESEYTMFDLEDGHSGTALQGTRMDKGIIKLVRSQSWTIMRQSEDVLYSRERLDMSRFGWRLGRER